MITIRPESSADIAAIHAVHVAAFPTDAEALLVDRLRERGNAKVSLVAESGGRVVGHILFSPVTIAGTTIAGLGLAPMAVLPEHQRRGIGSRLIREGLTSCRERNCPFVVVLGWPEYYPRFGFRQASAFGLRNEYGADSQFMVLELTAGSLPPAGGLVRYGPEFAEWEV